MNKAFWEISGKNLSVLTSSKTEEELPDSNVHNPQRDLLGSFPADLCPGITTQFGCGHRAKFSISVGGTGGEGWFDWKLGVA